MTMYSVKLVLLLFVLCEGQIDELLSTVPQPPFQIHSELIEKIGNFSIEILYHTSKVQPKKSNLNVSPITVWSMLAITAEAATGQTSNEINNALRLITRKIVETRREFANITQYHAVSTSDVELAKVNAIFLDKPLIPNHGFKDIASTFYDTQMVNLDFKNAEIVANIVNKVIANTTKGRITNLVDSEFLSEAQMILTSALYFKGAWTIPFNSSSTKKMPFYSSDGKIIGEVNMMYNKHTYPLTNIKTLQAKIIELPYGTENRLSMLVMLPHPGISLESMFLNFGKTTLDAVFEELRKSREEYEEEEVECFLPRFKIDSDLDMTPILKSRFGIHDLFDEEKAELALLSPELVYVSKVIHKAQIEVTEEGTIAAAATAAKFGSRFGVFRFEANSPFTYMIVERITNSILFGGIYQVPSLF